MTWKYKGLKDIDSLEEVCQQLLKKLKPLNPPLEEEHALCEDIRQREQLQTKSVLLTLEKSLKEVYQAVHVLSRWMVDNAIVRFIGAGRAKLAGAIPANRLAH
ncbi:MAG: hypothetical protein HQ559_06660 [Lentisphaerae bacterium]|nr:hypothetical protein [Lentisphaerota bacterium]